jgi:hypothetical protein
VACFAKAFNSGIFVNFFSGASWIVTDWSGYEDLSGTPNDNAGCTNQATGELVCGGISVTDAAFYANVFNGSSWTGWTKVGGSGVGSPSCAPLGSGKVVCPLMGPTNKLTSVVGP